MLFNKVQRGVLSPGYSNCDILAFSRRTKNSTVGPLEIELWNKKKKRNGKKEAESSILLCLILFWQALSKKCKNIQAWKLNIVVLYVFTFSWERLLTENKTEQNRPVLLVGFASFYVGTVLYYLVQAKLLFNGQTKCHTGMNRAQPGNRTPPKQSCNVVVYLNSLLAEVAHQKYLKYLVFWEAYSTIIMFFVTQFFKLRIWLLKIIERLNTIFICRETYFTFVQTPLK